MEDRQDEITRDPRLIEAYLGAGERSRVSIHCGNGGILLPIEMARGADGAMTRVEQPEMMVALIAAWKGR